MIGLLRKLFHRGIRTALRYGPSSRVVASFVIDADKRRTITVRGKEMAFWISSAKINQYFLPGPDGIVKYAQKETETLDFLAAHLRDDDVFYDVGANVGFYVVYAKKLAALRHVVALEPEALNYAELCRNIWANNLEKVTALCAGASDIEAYEDYVLQQFTAGNHSGKTARYTRGLPNAGADPNDRVASGYSQKIQLVPLDLLIERAGLPKPSVLLMDIDGGEINALKGMDDTLADPSLRALVIEWAPNTRDAVLSIVEPYGFLRQGIDAVGRSNAFFLRS